MDLFTALTNNNIQNVNAPLPLPAHIAFCVIASLLYIIQYKRIQINYYIYLLIAVDLTLVTQFYVQDYVIAAIGVAEVILLVMAFLSQRKHKKELKILEEKEKQAEIMAEGENDGKAMRADVHRISDKIEEYAKEQEEQETQE